MCRAYARTNPESPLRVASRHTEGISCIKTEVHAPGFDEFALRILFYARYRAKEVKGARQRGKLTIPFPQNYRKIARPGLVPRTGSGL